MVFTRNESIPYRYLDLFILLYVKQNVHIFRNIYLFRKYFFLGYILHISKYMNGIIIDICKNIFIA